MGPYLGAFVVITALLLAKCFPCKYKGATSTTVLNTKYKVHQTTLCAFSLYQWKVFDSVFALDLNLKELYTKFGIFNNCDYVNESRCY